MNHSAKLIRRLDRIRAVWQLTPSLNTARRCEARMTAIASQARGEHDAACTQLDELPLPAPKDFSPGRPATKPLDTLPTTAGEACREAAGEHMRSARGNSFSS